MAKIGFNNSGKKIKSYAWDTFLANTDAVIFFKDTDLAYTDVSGAFLELAGVDSAGNIKGKTCSQVFGDSELTRKYASDDRTVLNKGISTVNHMEPFPSKSGQMRYFSIKRYPIKDQSGSVKGILGIVQEYGSQGDEQEETDRQKIIHEYDIRLKLYQSLCENVLPNMLYAFAADIHGWKIEDEFFQNERCREWFHQNSIDKYMQAENAAVADDGFVRDYFSGLNPKSAEKACTSGSNISMSYLRKFPDGSERWVVCEIKYIKQINGRPLMLCMLLDADEKRRLIDGLKRSAETDALTGLLSRDKAIKDISDFLNDEKHSGQHALFIVNIDNLKNINKSLGILQGDQAIAGVASLLLTLFRETDIAGRIGGDEFMILWKNADNLNAVLNKAKDIVNGVSLKAIAGIKLSVSVGLTLCRTGNKAWNVVYSEAETALQHAKRYGKNKFIFYNDVLKLTEAKSELLDNTDPESLNFIENNTSISLIFAGIRNDSIEVIYRTLPNSDKIECIFDKDSAAGSEAEDNNHKRIIENTIALSDDSKYIDTYFNLDTKGSDGTRYEELTHFLGVRIPQDGRRYIAGLLTNVTAIYNYTELLRNIVKNLPIGIGLFEIDGEYIRTIYVNNESLIISDFNNENYRQIINENALNAVHPEDRHYVKQYIKTIVASEESVELFFRSNPDLTKTRVMRTKAFKIGTVKGNPIVLAAFLDVVISQDNSSASASNENAIALLKRNLEIGYRHFSMFMQKTGAGIAIARKSPGDTIFRTEYVNDGLLKILGMTMEQFQTSPYGRDNNAFNGFHPDDMKTVLNLVNNIPKTDHYETTIDYRTLCGDGTYKWVNATGSFDLEEDGSIVLYVIYLDIDEQKKAENVLQQNYQRFQSEVDALGQLTLFSFWINLSKNTARDIYTDTSDDIPNLIMNTAEDSVQKLSERITSSKQRQEYLSTFGRENLIAAFKRGERTVSYEHLFQLSAKLNMWIKTYAYMIINPDTSDIEALLYSVDVNLNKAIRFAMSKYIGLEYDFISIIDITSGIITNIITNEQVLYLPANGISYSDEYLKTIEQMVPASFNAEYEKAMNLNSIIEAINQDDIYTTTYPLNTHDSVMEYKNWQFMWFTEDKSQIMFSCRKIANNYQVRYDSLTALYTRSSFVAVANESIMQKSANYYTIIYINVSDFKIINDRFGRKEGDRLLLYISRYIHNANAKGAELLSCRDGADIFIILCSNEHFPIIQQMMQDIMAQKTDSFPFSIMLKIGLYSIDDPLSDVNLSIDKAMLAQQSLKDNVTRHYAYYDSSMLKKIRTNQELVNDMEAGIRDRQFRIYIQPQYDYETGKLSGGEALVRWEHPTKGLLMPGSFIKVFEQNGLISMLDHYIWEESCRYMKLWMDSKKIQAPVPISINISRIDINKNIDTEFIDLLERYGLPRNMLNLEITESAYMDDPERLTEVINNLKSCGFTVEIDDFGSGYSSLNTLKDIDVDILKLDMKFLDSQNDNEKTKVIIGSIINMAHALKMSVIAEGVETKEQADFLQSVDCDFMQGFLLSKPLPAEEFEHLMEENGLLSIS